MGLADDSDVGDEEDSLLAEANDGVPNGNTNDLVSLCLRQPVVDWVCEHGVVDPFIWDFEFVHDGTNVSEADEISGGLFHLKYLSLPDVANRKKGLPCDRKAGGGDDVIVFWFSWD